MPSRKIKLQPAFRLYLEEKAKTVIDQTDAMLLRFVGETGSLSTAAEKAGVSYRNAWDRVKELERGLGKRVVETKVGGASGGGAELTPEGEALLKEFRRVRKHLFDALEERDFWGHASYKLSARNRIRARVVYVKKGDVISQVRMTSLRPAGLVSIISNEAVEDLGLKEGDEVDAIIKSTEVLIAKEA